LSSAPIQQRYRPLRRRPPPKKTEPADAPNTDAARDGSEFPDALDDLNLAVHAVTTARAAPRGTRSNTDRRTHDTTIYLEDVKLFT
jgi:hypothetical protein